MVIVGIWSKTAHNIHTLLKMKLGLIISFLLYFVMLMGNQGCNGCLEKERIGLLEIKHYIVSQDEGDSLNTASKKLVSWVDDRGSNCCSWKRVKCSNISSGHITELSLQELLYHMMLNVSLFRPFEELCTLDLSNNYFGGWIGNEGTTLVHVYKFSLTNLYKLEKLVKFYLLG